MLIFRNQYNYGWSSETNTKVLCSSHTRWYWFLKINTTVVLIFQNQHHSICSHTQWCWFLYISTTVVLVCQNQHHCYIGFCMSVFEDQHHCDVGLSKSTPQYYVLLTHSCLLKINTTVVLVFRNHHHTQCYVLLTQCCWFPKINATVVLIF